MYFPSRFRVLLFGFFSVFGGWKEPRGVIGRFYLGMKIFSLFLRFCNRSCNLEVLRLIVVWTQIESRKRVIFRVDNLYELHDNYVVIWNFRSCLDTGSLKCTRFYCALWREIIKVVYWQRMFFSNGNDYRTFCKKILPTLPEVKVVSRWLIFAW